MARRLYADRRGISPVVATVILVAVTIVVAVAVAYWMGGLTAIYTRFEKLEITSAYAEQTTNGYNITLHLKNSGSADATIDNILINGKPYITHGCDVNPPPPIPIKAGQADVTIVITANAGNEPFTPGTSIEVKIHTAAGQEYPKVITLP